MSRLVSVATSVAILVFLLPVYALVSVIILLVLGQPILFRQTRAGLHGQPFTLYKFRTMSDQRDAQGNLLPDNQRLTKLGRFLRATSLDELPQLWNVLKGDMSIIGPRPLLAEYLPRYSKQQMRRHEVKPGLTGWAQINGRNALSWEQKFELDVWYIDHRSLALDLKILALTVLRVLRSDGHATMSEFTGTPRT